MGIICLLQAAVTRLTLDNTDQRASFDSQLALAERSAGGMRVSSRLRSHLSDGHTLSYPLFHARLPPQVVFDKLTVDNADQRASMARAEQDAGGMKVSLVLYSIA